MKYVPALCLLLLCGSAQAAPRLLADPYPATGVQPDTAAVTINGGAPLACTLVAVTGGLQPQCDLVSITNPGTYTLVMTVTKAASIVNTPGGAVNSPGGSASSAPFSYRLQAAGVAGPTLSVSP